MINILLNNKSLVLKAINEGVIDETNYGMIISGIIKYFYLLFMEDNLNNKDLKLLIEKETIKVIKKCRGKDFNYFIAEAMVESRIQKMFSKIDRNKTVPILEDIEKVPITKNELKKINSFEDKKTRKILFIFLVYSKINNILYGNSQYRVSQTSSMIFKEARLNDNKFNREMFIGSLMKQGLLSMGSKCDTSLIVNYADDTSPIEFYVEDLDDRCAIYSYLNYMGEKWKKCFNIYIDEKTKEEVVCNKYFKISSNRQLYCPHCQRLKQSEWEKKSKSQKS